MSGEHFPGPEQITPEQAGAGLSRRGFLLAGMAGVAGGGAALVAALRGGAQPDPLAGLADEQGQRAAVFVAQAESYDVPEALVARILEGFQELGLERSRLQGKRILLKPNLVETKPNNPHINTDPRLLLAAAEAFRRCDAAEVAVAEGQGHRRDSLMVLEEAGFLDALAEGALPFTDLNHDELFRVANGGNATRLRQLVLPQRLRWADLVVSFPKLKTHHWVGCTLSLKNLFGVMPGIFYGWPKNVLHHQGIDNSILDINATVRPGLAIVDGIVGMEGDGPINGTPKQAGVIVMGTQPAAVDATCARVMGLKVEAVEYLVRASGLGLGPVRELHIEQRGAALHQVTQDFAVLTEYAHLAGLKG